MKKVFIMTPIEINEEVTTEKINTYIRKMSGAIKAILDEDIEVVTNFFLEPVGVDKDGEKIMQVRNRNDEIAYMAEELAAIETCDYIAVPEFISYTGEIEELWSCNYGTFSNARPWMNGRKIISLPIQVLDHDHSTQRYNVHKPNNRRIY